LYNSKTKKGKFLFTNKPELENYKLEEMDTVEIKARDGLIIPSYVTRPFKDRAGPTVILVHGGPNARDDWGLDPEVQLLANRGYAVV
jgi:dipeptidyl aminopeptidase/acylaminoacyl peptidase